MLILVLLIFDELEQACPGSTNRKIIFFCTCILFVIIFPNSIRSKAIRLKKKSETWLADHLVIYRNSPAPGTLLELSRNWQGAKKITCDMRHATNQFSQTLCICIN